MQRAFVPNDNSCLFYAVAHNCENAPASHPLEQRLRKLVADDVLQNGDELTLGRPVKEYAEWIQNTFNWGGENELIFLAKHYNIQIAVISSNGFTLLVYGADLPAPKGRIYILYTGTHYDPLVGPNDTRLFPPVSDPEIEKQCVEIAKMHVAEAARRAKQRVLKRIKCNGCGALSVDSTAFQAHCMEVDHDDDFAYDCSEVEVVLEGDEPLPEDTIDLNAPTVHCFYNNALAPFSNAYPCDVTVDGVLYRSLENYWQAAKYLQTAPDIAAKIAAAPDAPEAHNISWAEGTNKQSATWDDEKSAVLLKGLRQKFAQHPDLAAQLLATGDKLIVCVDQDSWAGMRSEDGITSGQNNIGKALMTVRSELKVDGAQSHSSAAAVDRS